MNITSVKEFFAALRSGSHTSIGCYPVYFVTKDGCALSFQAAKENAKTIGRAIRDCNDKQWEVIATDINWEDQNLICEHTSETIESAYGD